MTIKTLLQISDTNIETRRKSDMQKRGAVRNLFNTTVDRDELQKQAAQLENESLATLQSYRLDSIIGVIESANDDQARKPKKSPRYDEGSDDEEPIRITRARIESDGAESSSADQEQPSLSTSSKKSSDLKLIASTRIPLPRGQKTLKDYYPIIKRKRHR